ncbi:MAG: DUF302 domain-containing protein [Chloroflexi bacterium]|nr:DUF302 domain-containing protein [Chloroflexota bacterium]
MTTQTPQRPYGFGTTLDAPYAEAVARVKGALKEEGFGILTEIDVRQTMQEKLGAEFRPYIILGACNPPLAHQALAADLGIGLLLPCNVVVYDNQDGTSSVEAMDPEAALGLVGDNPVVAGVAREARSRLQRALGALAPGTL